MAILKQAKNIIIKAQSDSNIIVNKTISKNASKIVLKTTLGDVQLIASKRLKTNSNGD
ncbi:hypothetical protein BSF41_17570 [Flavobacterium sp. ACN2]|jgi:hypothetical protein|uniref:hypothetical protein n=1 Tax=unclassified Flavobacterium TaxID=196869 RepID=UPI0015533E78|nr:hypothetical protein [Flavobacterium sp. ACN2]PBI90086.1 hypothetical protein BSF41_17570 [Flavobacterium sp. ACN2]